MGSSMGQFGDTTLTKVFVGGLAWETQKEALGEHFDRYGEILEAVIISDKVTGRSKGYGFVTFKKAEAAKKACEDAAPTINGRRANCNLASLGARKLRASPPTPTAPQKQQPAGLAAPAARVVATPPPPAGPAHWYYSSGAPQPPPFHHHHQYHGFPFYTAYGYSPSYVADVGYNGQKLSRYSGGGGSHLQQGHFHQQAPYPGQAGMVAPNGLFPVYPLYHYHHYHQQQQPSQTMGMPTNLFPAAGPFAAVPAAIISKPAAMPPATVCLAVEQVTGCS